MSSHQDTRRTVEALVKLVSFSYTAIKRALVWTASCRLWGRGSNKEGPIHFQAILRTRRPNSAPVMHAHGSRSGRVYTFVCLCVCLFFRTMSQKTMHLGPPNLT